MKNISNWKKKRIKQQPDWKNKKLLSEILNQIKNYPNLVSIEEINNLKKELALAHKGEKIILQAGDCAETFIDFNEQMIENKIKIILQMSAILKYSSNIDVITIGRIAGQFAKPRGQKIEKKEDAILPVYRGDAVNDVQFDIQARMPNPKRLLQAYNQSAATMNLIRSLLMRGFTHVNNIKEWKLSFLDQSENESKYNKIVKQIKNALQFATLNTSEKKLNFQNNLFISHEALLLNYEEAFLQYNSKQNNYYDCSSHMLWIGDRTRDLDGAHIEFASQIQNPIGIKIGPTFNIKELKLLCKKLNPNNEIDKLILIIRLGSKKINLLLPKLIKEIQDNKLNVIWMCDPMHGNTIVSKNGIKTRNVDTIKSELEQFFKIHLKNKTIPAGIHLELTGEDVTECLGGVNQVRDVDLTQYYNTACDPRLNYEQSLEMAFLISNLLIKNRR